MSLSSVEEGQVTVRAISWIKSVRREFEAFPIAAQLEILTALEIAARGQKSIIAKPLKGIDGGVFEVALPFRGDAFRVIYAVQIDDDLWVVHAFQKKSKTGIKTPQHEIDLIKRRLRQLREALS